MGPYLLVLHDDRARISCIKTENIFRNFHKTNNPVSDYFHFSIKTKFTVQFFIYEKVVRSWLHLHVASSPTPLVLNNK